MPSYHNFAAALITALAVWVMPWSAGASPAAPSPSSPTAETRLKQLKDKHGDGLLYDVDDKLMLIFATSTDQKTLDEVKLKLTAHARALRTDLFVTGLKDYVIWNQKQFMKAPGNHYSQAQSMMFYLHHSGKLKPWYDAYVAGFGKDPTGASAFEKVFAKPLPEIEKDWVAWVNSQSLPKEVPRPASPVTTNPPSPQP